MAAVQAYYGRVPKDGCNSRPTTCRATAAADTWGHGRLPEQSKSKRLGTTSGINRDHHASRHEGQCPRTEAMKVKPHSPARTTVAPGSSQLGGFRTV